MVHTLTRLLLDLVVLSVAVLAAVAAFALALRWAVRRRWRSLRARLTANGVGLVTGSASALLSRRAEPGGAIGLPWRPEERARRHLGRAVSGAETAVRSAAAAGAPVGELPALCRRLRAAATDADTLLRIGTAGRTECPDEVRVQVADVLDAADSIRAAALAAARAHAAPHSRTLAEDAAREAQALIAGSARAQVAALSDTQLSDTQLSGVPLSGG